MSHKTEDFKLSAVKFYLKNKDKLRKTCKIFGCTKSYKNKKGVGITSFLFTNRISFIECIETNYT